MPVVTHREIPLFTSGQTFDGTGTLTSNDFKFPDLPNEIGLYSFFADIVDNGSELLPTVKAYLQYIFDDDNDIYGENNEILDTSGTNIINVGTKFEARLDTQEWWKFAIGFRIVLEVSGGTSPSIKLNYVGVHAR